jgi:hypothetical protein
LLYINDVGQDDWEEINLGVAGANYGWPITEGDFDEEDFPTLTPPVQTYNHSEGCSIVGGVFYPQNSIQFPEQYEGKYFFQDFCGGWIRYIDPANPSVSSTFATGIDFPIDMTVDADGSLYYLSRGGDAGGQPSGEGALFKIAYTADVPPHVNDQPEDQLVSVGFPAGFIAGATGSAPLAYQWQRSESGSGVWADIPSATSTTFQLATTALADNGDQFRLRVTNNFGTATSDPATLSVTTNLPPVPTITLPSVGATYNAGQLLAFSGTGADNEDGSLPASAYKWQIDFHHNTHSHPFFPPTAGITTGSVTIPVIGETASDVWYRVHLTVTDSIGLTSTTFRDVIPNTIDLTLASNVPGVQLSLDGQPKDTPHSVEGVVGILRSLSAPMVAMVGNQTYQFVGWSHGGSQTNVISTPSVDTTFTANYVPVDATYLSDLPFFGTPINGWGPVERDLSNGDVDAGDGVPLQLRGTTYAKGLGTHAESDVTFNLAGGYTRFLADVGVDDQMQGVGSVVFQVFADDTKMYDSGTTFGSAPVKFVDVNVTGVNLLRLVVTDAGDGIDFDHADWADALLLSIPPQPPAAPSGLTATALSGSDIRVTWIDNATTETGFQIDRSPNGTNGWTQVGTAGANATTFINSGLTASTTYFYRVRAFNGSGPSANSNVASATTTAQVTTFISDLPFVGTPINGWGPVERDLSNGDVDAGDGAPLQLRGLTYSKGLGTHAASDVTFNLAGAYTKFLSNVGIDDETEGEGSVVFQLFANGTKVYDSGTIFGNAPVQFVDVNVTGVNQLRLVVTGAGDGIDFDHADWADARLLSTPPQPPAAPSGLAATALSGTEIRLNWSDNAANETGFQIDRSPNGTTGWTQVGTAGANATTFTNTGLTASTTYFYRVRAVNAGGPSANSNVADATTTAQVVTYLSDLPFVGTPVNGWGPVERDRSNGEQGATDGGPLSIRGTTYAKGLGVHSTSRVMINLAGAYTTFLSNIGIDDETDGSGSVVFQVWADGVMVYTSGTILGTSAVQAVNLSVAGVNQLELRVNASTNGTNFDHADWADARFLSTPPQSFATPIAALPSLSNSGTASTRKKPVSMAQERVTSKQIDPNLVEAAETKTAPSQGMPGLSRKYTNTDLSLKGRLADDLVSLLAADLVERFRGAPFP